jgi:hypothetical protein
LQHPSSQPEKKQSSSDARTQPTQATNKPQPNINLDFIKDLTKKLEAKKKTELGEPINLGDIVNP